VTAPARQQVSPSLAFGTFTLLVSAVLLMVGTDMNWVTVGPIGTQGLNVADGVTGFSVVIIGIVLTALAAGQVVNDDDWGLRVLSLVTSWTALGFAIYFLVRVLQAINAPLAPHDASVGSGLIIVMIAAVVAAAASGLRPPLGRAGYCGGPELSWTVAVWVFPLVSVHPTVTLSPGW
jgi:hypothetical protein